MENLIGRTFNFLTVIEGPIRKDTTKKIFWKCKCQCGKEKIVRGDQLKAGTTKSCGCFKKQLFIERNIKRQTLDLTNMRFGKLVALEKTNDRKNGRVIWKCKCDCGAIVFCDTHSLQQGNTQSCGCLRSKGEEKIRKILKENNIPFEEQKTFETCKFDDSGYLAKFDFYINNKYIIEYDGEQHFYYKVGANTWNNEENYKIVKSHDEIKNNWCKENNIPIIRIPYYDLNKITIKDLLEDSEYTIYRKDIFMTYREEHPRCTYCNNYDKGFCKKSESKIDTILTACSCKDYSLDGNVVKKEENNEIRK